MKYNIREMSWYKRRTPTKELLPERVVHIHDLQLIHNHACEMEVLCDDGNLYILSARVQQNQMKKEKWTVHGLNPYGLSVLVDLEEDDED